MPGTCTHTQARRYCRHEPEKHPLYQVLAQHLETFGERTRTGGHQLPGYVEQELRAYLRCGILAHGFVRLRCEDCGESRAVAFSCKRRGWCPSCMGRRMADTAARLVEEVLPQVPGRQFVRSLPFEIRYRVAWDGKLISALLAVFLRTVTAWYRRQARAQGYTDAGCGSVTFVQRFGSAINLNPHFHVLLFDGVYVAAAEGAAPDFIPAPPLEDGDVQEIVETAAERIVRLLQRRGLLDDSQEDELTEAEPLQAALAAASVQGQLATGERAGQRVRRLLSDAAQAVRSAPLCFAARGFSLHAATRLDDDDRAGLERLIRYATRPPLAAGRLRIIDDERLTFRLKAPWSDGTTHLVLSPHELIEKLAALVPPPRLNLVRYHGVLAPNASARKQIVPSPPAAEESGIEPADVEAPQARAHRRTWAVLLSRIFDVDGTLCPSCGGRMRLIAALTDEVSIRHYLKGVGLPSVPPPIAPARPPPQTEFEFGA